eukprot:3478288-Pyramimonas_sp.AAC.1
MAPKSSCLSVATSVHKEKAMSAESKCDWKASLSSMATAPDSPSPSETFNAWRPRARAWLPLGAWAPTA